MSCLGHELISKGWPTIPLCWTDPSGVCACGRRHAAKNAGKAPLTPHGVKDATTDVAQVKDWFRRWPKANWAVACGVVSVIDIDDVDLASKLKEDEELNSHHFIVSTPNRGGLHIYLVEENTTRQKRVLFTEEGQRLGELQRGGSYVVAPGSKIGIGEYKPLTANAPANVEDAEDWLADTLERFGLTLRHANPLTAQVQVPLDTGGVDAEAALHKALRTLEPERAERLQAVLDEPEGHQYSSPSEADYAAVSTLVEAGLSDAEVASVWRSSYLGHRPKVQKRPDYVGRTIANARAANELNKSSSLGTSAIRSLDAENIESGPDVSLWRGLANLEVTSDLRGEFAHALLQSTAEQVITLLQPIIRQSEAIAQVSDELGPPTERARTTIHLPTVDLPSEPLLVAAAPGVGKTYRVVELAENPDYAEKLPILHLVPSHKSFDNVDRSIVWGHWYGHEDGQDGAEVCPAYVRASKGYSSGLECNCGARDAAGHIEVIPTVSPVEYVLADSPEGPPLRPAAMSFPLWVFDDVGLDKFINTVAIAKNDVSVTAKYHPHEAARTLSEALLHC